MRANRYIYLIGSFCICYNIEKQLRGENMIGLEIDVKQVLQDRLAASLGLDKYQFIMDTAKRVDVSKDIEFQRMFNGFYRVRRDETWRKSYYEIFERMKYYEATFAEIITYLYEKTGNIEASFSSKLLATLNPDKPIWDQYVLQNLSLELKGKTQEQKLDNAICLYNEIEKWYDEFLGTDKAKEYINEFDEMLPNYKWVSSVKKIDTVLWSIRWKSQ